MSIRDTWHTPTAFVEQLKLKLNLPIVLDPCSDGDNICNNFITEEQDGLATSWKTEEQGMVFCNPGYSNCLPWFQKAIMEAQQGVTSVILTHTCLGATWFNEVRREISSLMFITPRIQFIPPKGVKASSNSRDSMLSIFKPREGYLNSEVLEASFLNWRQPSPNSTKVQTAINILDDLF